MPSVQKPRSTALRPRIESYTDYRTLLNDVYAWRKRQPDGYTYVRWSIEAGVCTAPYLNMVLRGKRDLSPSDAAPVARALGLSAREATFVRRLVELARAGDGAARDAALGKLSRRASFRQHFRIDGNRAAYLRDWTVMAVHALTGTADFRADAAWIASRLAPRVSVRQAQSALDTLRALGMLPSESGVAAQTPRIVTTDTASPDPALGHDAGRDDPETPTKAESPLDADVYRSMHLKGAKLGLWAIENQPESRRRFGSLTAAVDAKGLARLLDAIDQKRRELAALLQELQTGQADTVVQINLQAFALTKETEADQKGKGGTDA